MTVCQSKIEMAWTIASIRLGFHEYLAGKYKWTTIKKIVINLIIGFQSRIEKFLMAMR